MPTMIKKPSYNEARSVLRNFSARGAKRDINWGAKQFNVNPGQDIQAAIDEVHNAGGGVVFLRAGTHYPTSDIVLYSNVTIVGAGLYATIIDLTLNHFRKPN